MFLPSHPLITVSERNVDLMMKTISCFIKTINNSVAILMKSDKIRGSYIVEASLIFPFICLVLVSILIISIYLHDVVVLKSVAHIAVSKTDIFNNDISSENYYYEESSKQQVINYITSKALQELIMKQGDFNVNYQINTTLISSQVKVDIVKDFILPFKFISKFFDGRNSFVIKIHVSSFSNRYNSPNIVRGIDFIDDMTDEINVTNEIKEKYENQINKLQNTINQWI